MFDIRELQERVIFEAVRDSSDPETAGEIIYGHDGSAKNESNPGWVKSTMYRLEDGLDPKIVKQIRMGCQCGYGTDQKLALLEGLKVASSNLEDSASLDRAKTADLFCKEGNLYLQFFSCPYPMLAGVDQLETRTWCQYTTGYSKTLFKKAFGREVDVDLLKSIKSSDDTCLMETTSKGLIWE